MHVKKFYKRRGVIEETGLENPLTQSNFKTKYSFNYIHINADLTSGEIHID